MFKETGNIGSSYYGDCPYCNQHIMIPNMMHLREACPSCLKIIYCYNGNFLTEDEYNNGEKLIHFIEEITDNVIKDVTNEEYKKWALSKTEFNNEKQIVQNKKRFGAGTIPKYHIKYYLEYIEKTENYYQCKLCGFVAETTRSKERVKNHLIENHLVNISLITPKIPKIENKRPIRHYLKPWKDPESLFCDTKFLKQLLGKEPAKGKECKDHTT